MFHVKKQRLENQNARVVQVEIVELRSGSVSSPTAAKVLGGAALLVECSGPDYFTPLASDSRLPSSINP